MDSNMSIQFSKNLPLPEKEKIFLSLPKYEPNKKPVRNIQIYFIRLREEFLKWQSMRASEVLQNLPHQGLIDLSHKNALCR